jgi:multiple sugar transport system permease protein
MFGMGLRSGLYIFIFRQFFRGLPKEIEEAALIDGASTLGTFIRVMLPNATPAIITVTVFSLVWQYNDTYYSSMLMNQINLIAVRLVSVGANFGIGEDIADPNRMKLVTHAAIVLGITPIVTIYMLLQRRFMEGLERSGIVG